MLYSCHVIILVGEVMCKLPHVSSDAKRDTYNLPKGMKIKRKCLIDTSIKVLSRHLPKQCKTN